MRLTNELRSDHELFRAVILPVLGPRTRIVRDPEGAPLVPGRLGRIEWRGVPAEGPLRLYAYTDRPRMIAKLLAVPGVHRWQIGDQEAAVWMAADDAGAIQAVARLLRTRVRRAPETGRSAAALAAARPDVPRPPEHGGHGGVQVRFEPREGVRPPFPAS